jgi:FAD/FMN-containing dehydrogenase/Fe-S oxidoreductase
VNPETGADLNTLLRLKARLAADTQAEVRFDAATRAAYGSEASNYRQVPIGVVLPRTVDDLVAVVAACAAEGLPIVTRGAGTSMAGQSVNAAVVIDHSRHLDAVLDVDAARRIATVEPGVICDDLKARAAVAGLTFGPDPATHSRCTLGGMIGNNSCGAHSMMAGKTVDNIARLEILTYDGARFWVGPTDAATYAEHVAAGGRRAEIVQSLKALADRHAQAIRDGFPRLKRRVSGYNLDQLLPENGFDIARALVGSEGTCVTVLRAETRLVANPASRVLVVLGFADIFLAADAVPALLPLGAIAMEGLDQGIVGGLEARGLKLQDIAELPPGDAWLMMEMAADDPASALCAAQRVEAACAGLPGVRSARIIADAALMNRIWTIRETGASATSLALDANEPDPTVGWEDAAVDPARLGDYLREFQALVTRHGYRTSLYGHFGDGCIHARITFDLKSHAGVARWRDFLVEAARLVVAYGGSLSGEHGDGQARGEFLPLMYPPEVMEAFREFKRIWDPSRRMNPGKLIDAMPVDAHLRSGPDSARRPVPSLFDYGDGLGDLSFARATERCIGMGKCRAHEGATMCPSFRATRDELHSTRGRARLFSEMLRGDLLQDGWRDPAIKASLELCLGCKGCKTDCPTHVDIARYKSEFLWRHYAGRRRPVAEAVLGRVGQWLPAATRVAPLVNAALGNAMLRRIGERLGLARSAVFPRLSRAFRRGATARRLLRSVDDRHLDAVLWTDSFNNAFAPEVIEAAVTSLEHFGMRIGIPRRHICCGRPLFDAGLLDEARTNLSRILDQLGPALARGLPVVVLEPSCLSVFRDELPALFPNDQRARSLARSVVTFAELLDSRGIALPAGADAPYVHGHCHQKACGGMKSEETLLDGLQAKGRVLDAGCCGMAGAYGYATKTAAVSEAIGRWQWLPRLSAVPASGTLVADGFSCRSQASRLAGREAIHLAQWVAQRLEGNRSRG